MKVKVATIGSLNFKKDLLDSVVNTGFVVITNHGIEEALIRKTQDDWRKFFLEGQEIKDLFINEKNLNMGYKGMRSEKAVGAKTADLKEFFHWQPEARIPYGCKRSTSIVFDELDQIGNMILKVIDEVDGTNYADMCYGSDNTILRSLYYPAMNFSKEPDAVRAAAHEDINFITLLVAASAPGLEVLDKKGNWHAVPHEQNSIVVNIGDMLALASDGKYKSTTHRVVNPDNSRQDRISMPLFVHPFSDTLLAPNFTAGEYLAQRIAEINGTK